MFHQTVDILSIVVIDLGGSFTKVIHAKTSNQISEMLLENTIGQSIQDVVNRHIRADTTDLILTGGKSRIENITTDVSIHRINELEALANTMRSQSKNPAIIVNIGTGTPFIFVQEKDYTHLGGTGMGGGTILGLANRLIEVHDPKILDEFALQGDKTNVNLTVEDIVGGGIGMIPGSATASNFAKLGGNNHDVAAGIISLVGEAIGVMVALLIKSHNLSEVYFSGGSIKLNSIQEILKVTLSHYNVDVKFLPDPEFSTALGALKWFKT